MFCDTFVTGGCRVEVAGLSMMADMVLRSTVWQNGTRIEHKILLFLFNFHF